MYFCVLKIERGGKRNMKKRSSFLKLASLLTALIIAFGSAFNVYALTLAELIGINNEKSEEDINVSYVSSKEILLGDTLSMYARQRGLDSKKCKYAFYAKYDVLTWIQLQAYSAKSDCEFIPKLAGNYQLCIKIQCDGKVYKKYFELVVSVPITNDSVISSSFIKRGESVRLSAKAAGGAGDFKYAYFIKKTDENELTTLCGYGTAGMIMWTPPESGEYDICIKAKDKADKVEKKYFTLTVSSDGRKSPSEFTITVKAPISSPYLWNCTVSDESILEYEITDKKYVSDMLNPYVMLEYHFRTIAPGTADINFDYSSYNGEHYFLKYNIVSDKNLNYNAASGEGSYFDSLLPEPEQVKKQFTVSVRKAAQDYDWKCEISDSLTAEYVKTEGDNAGNEIYYFNALRKGAATITLSCVSKSDISTKYKLIYNIMVDDNFDVTTSTYDGYYFFDAEIPKIVVE